MKIIDFNNSKRLCAKLPINQYLNWVNFALLNKNDFVMPNKSRISQDNGDYYAIMPCMYPKDNIAMVKMIGRHTLKEGEKRPTMMSDMMLYEADSGVLKAVMDAEYITTLRTGAAAAQAALLYGKKNFSKVGLIGLGNIMTVCAEILFAQITDRKIEVKVYKHHEQEIRFATRFQKFTNLKFIFCNTYDEVVRESDVIISAVTRVESDFCDISCYKEGCTVIPIMTLGFQNCDLFFDKVFTDEIDQIKGFKYFNQFKSVDNTTDVLSGKIKGRETEKERILVYYYGLAIHDLYFASRIYNLAVDVEDVKYNYCKEKFFV